MSQRELTVQIRGDGIAAACAEWLLDRNGVSVSSVPAGRPKVPVVMLGLTTQKLLCDVFEDPLLFEGLQPINKRIVKWGARAVDAHSFSHNAVVVSEYELFRRIRAVSPESRYRSDGQPSWRIYASRPLPQPNVAQQFGSRIAETSAVQLKAAVTRDSCWVESLNNGWLFLIPAGEESAWLLSVGDAIDRLLAESQLIARQLESVVSSGGSFPSHPRIANPLCGSGWLACGTAALGFDPLCGDGTGHAVREAILAAAVIRAVQAGADMGEMLALYQARLLAGFSRHLKVCRDFYTAGHPGAWWEIERQAIEEGLAWTASVRTSAATSRFRLNGFTLEPVCR